MKQTSGAITMVKNKVTLEEEMRKNPQLRMEDIQQLREWAQSQPDLPEITDMKLLLFLHACDNSIEHAKTTIKNYCTYQVSTPEVFSNRDPTSEELKQNCEAVGMIILDGRDNNGHVVFVQNLLDTDPNKYNMDTSMKRAVMLLEVWQMENGTVPGATLVYDQKGFGLGHMTRAPLSAIRNCVNYVQECSPLKVEAIHVINTNAVLDAILAIFRPFMKRSLFSKIQTHRSSDFRSLFKYVPQHILPKDYGGDTPSVADQSDVLMKKLEAYRDYFIAEDTKMSTRRCTTKSNDALGVAGSFKKLDID